MFFTREHFFNTMYLYVFVLTLGFTCFSGSNCQHPVVNTRLGTIQGRKLQTSFNGRSGTVVAFRGIPYAESPTGTRRFQKPVPKASLPNPFDAADFGPGCAQDLMMMMGWVPGYPYVAEDCLTLNIFTPENAYATGNHSNYAVLLWMHGGAYTIGQSKMYSAENLTLIGDIVVVTINYRLTSLGFLSTGSSKYPGNLGLWDQQMAIKWVHDHIAEFGGDPRRITLAGESAGGASAVFQALYPGNKGLFHRVIADSGSPLCPWAYQVDPARYARRLADKSGCTDRDLDAAVDCLQKLDVMTLVNNSRVGTQDETAFRAEWLPSFDNDFITRPQQELFTSGLEFFREVDYLIGMNNNDGAFATLLSIQPFMTQRLNKTFEAGIPGDFFRNFYIPMYLKDFRGNTSKIMEDLVSHVYSDWRDLHNDNYTREKFLQFSGDYFFFMPMLSTVRAHAQRPAARKTFIFEFTVRPKFNTSPAWVTGTNHGEELPFVFGFPDLMADGMGYRNNILDSEIKISNNLMIMWSNFVKTGDPNIGITVPDSIVWPEYNLDTKRFLKIAHNNTHSAQNVFGARTSFWMDIEPQLYKLTEAASHISHIPLPVVVG